MVELKESYIKTSKGRIFYRYYKLDIEDKENKNIIFLHGLGASSKVWSRVASAMPPKYNLYFIDLLGHGNSDAPIIDYNINVQVDVLKEFVDNLELSNLYIVGHSYGGWIAATYAINFNLNALVLEDSAGLDIDFNSTSPKEALAMKEKMFYQIMKIDGNRSYVIKNILDSEFSKEWLTQESLSEIQTPTLIIWGENDKIINPEYAAVFNARIKNSKIKIIKGAGHNAHYTNSKEFSEILNEFIDEN